jgi:hypothetical protein
VTKFVGIAMRGCALIIALFLGTIAAGAQDDTASESIDHFYGRFSGGAEIKGDPSAPARRESEVEVAPTDDGFQITWTTLSLDTSNVGGVKVKTAVERFVRTDRPQVFHSEEPGDPLNDKPLTWANISGNTLTMTTMTIWPDGTHDIATWSRRVVGDQMTLIFTRIQDGEIVRRVEGDLVKIDDLD